MHSKDLLVVGNLAKDIVFGVENFGGCATAIAVNARRMGVTAGVMSVVGQDDFSSRFLRFLETNSVDTTLVDRTIEKIPECIVNSRENRISSSTWIDNGCHPAMDQMTVTPARLAEYRLTHLVSVPPNLSSRLANLNLHFSYEPGPILVSNPDYFDLRVAQKSQLVFFNEEEAQIVLDKHSVSEIIPILGQMLIVTLGSKGVDIYSRQKHGVTTEHVEAIPVQDNLVVDAVGAGDCFKAGFLTGLLQNFSLFRCAVLGTELGAICVAQNGSLINQNKIDRIMLKYKNE